MSDKSVGPRPAARDRGFVVGWHGHLVGLHFDRQEILSRAKTSARGPRLERIEQKLRDLPLYGPDTVSRVMAIENVLSSLGARLPPPPRSPVEYETWHKAAIAACKPDRERLGELAESPGSGGVVLGWLYLTEAVRLGLFLGDLERTVALWAMCHELAAEGPPDELLQKQRAALFATVAPLLDVIERTTRDGTGGPLVAVERWATRARPVLAQARGFLRARPEPVQLEELCLEVHRLARFIERSLAHPTPPEAITAFRAGRLTRPALLRALVAHPDWRIDVRAHEGVAYAYSAEPAQLAPGAGSSGPARLEGGGEHVFGALAPDEQRTVVLDPGTATELRLEASESDELSRLAAAALVEEGAGGEPQTDWRRLVAYDRWYVLARPDRTIQPIRVGPDPDVLFTALFTHVDCAEAWEAAHPGERHPAASWACMPGRDLFPVLAGFLEASNGAGVCLNPAGPGTTRHYSVGAVRLLAQEAARQRPGRSAGS